MTNTFVDSLLPQLEAHEQLVFFRLYRLSYGHQRDWCLVSYPKLAETLHLGRSTVERTVASLKRKGLVVPVESVLGGRSESRGNKYRVILPDGTLPREGSLSGRKTVPREGRVPTQTPMKVLERHDMKAPAAVAPALDVFGIRTIAARLFEAHRGEMGFDHERLRQLVRDTLIGQGTAPDDDLIEEAIRGMAE